MESFNFIDFLKDNQILDNKKYDSLRFELDTHLHYYGNHFKYPFENSFSKKSNLLWSNLRYLYSLYKIFKNKAQGSLKEIILSNSYFTVNNELKNLGYDVFCPSWQMTQDRNVLSSYELFTRGENIKSKFKTLAFNQLISNDFIEELNHFEEILNLFFRDKIIKALFVPNDVSFFENLAIHSCKQIGVPSFIFLHGLPGRYNPIDENRSDYLIVWGEKIKENYIKAGINPDKIFISGHPYYKKIQSNTLKNDFDNILVITKSLNGANHSDGIILGDRANLLLYLYSVEKILKRIGVKSVRFRPHPSENGDWYLKFINTNFYKLDKGTLNQSIQNSSMVIGPTSTVFLESLYYGKNYVIYEPSNNNIDLINNRLVPPFDGTDSKIPVAKNEDELEYILKHKIIVELSCFSDYIKTPFDLSFVKKLI